MASNLSFATSSSAPLLFFFFLAAIFEPIIAASRKLTALVPCMLRIIFLLAICSTLPTLFAGNGTDRSALLAFKHSLQDPQMAMSSWNDSFHFCRWEGVACGRHHQRVTRLEFDSKRLVGSLSPHVGNLSFLRVLSLPNCSLHGEIPSQLGRLFRLQMLFLPLNNFEGEIPANISHCSNLTILVVGDNNVVGKLPEELGALSKLTTLNVQRNNFTGGIPFLGNLTSLTVLAVAFNQIGGSIPNSIGQLKYLNFLGFFNNNFEGEIPANISHCSNLTILDVGDNNLVGKIPEELGALSKLTTLVVEHNSFSGGIPFLGNLTSLTDLVIAHNRIGGSIPNSIDQLKHLNYLQFEFNNFSGEIPPSLYNLSSLTLLSLQYNQLKGNLLPNIGLMLPNLQIFQFSSNQFTGTLPPSLSNCSDLRRLEVELNHFFGKIEIDFGGMKNLRSLVVGGNNFGSGELDEMHFIGSASNCSKLKVLDLMGNRFSGSLPNSLGNLSSQMQTLDLARNQIFGVLPSTIGNLVGLTSLFLDVNQFTGKIPSSIGKLEKLQILGFGNNTFSGRIPYSIGNLSLLTKLYMGMNRLDGEIPASLGNCQTLLSIELSQNNLSGLIPTEIFNLSTLAITLDLSWNYLFGHLPLDVGNLKNLGSLDFSNNDLSGEIPSGLGSCSTLENLFLQENNFQGLVPSSLGSLKGAINIDLSHNNLSGQIPRFFEQLSVKYLNLSFNNFEGEVPIRGVFANQSGISVVGNSKLCGGMPELRLQRCYIEESKKRRGRSRALIIGISIVCTFLCVTIILVIFLFYRHDKRRKVKSSGSLLKERFLRVSYEQLLKATDGFSTVNMVGKGGFSSVYKGILNVDEGVVAVKVLDLQSRGASKSFMIECEALRRVRHRNLVRIITSCSSIDFQGNEFKALVYEFMPNGSLERWLHSSPEAHNDRDELHRVGLLERINIAIDVACALDYLHHHCEEPIIHCDLKPSNILLDGDMVAHVGDFGVAKFLLHELTDTIESSSTRLRGTIGYAAPEYGLGSEISTNGDVYSFGILLLEMITGKRPTDNMFKDDLDIHNFASMALPEHVKDIVDPLILEVSEEATCANITECLVSAARVAVACSNESPQARMSITNVFHELNSIRNIILQ